MRNEVYDKLLREGIEKIKANPESVTYPNEKLDAFNEVLNETNAENLAKYYKNMDEFYGANNNDITKMSPHYLLTKNPHLCDGKNCTVKEVKESEIVGEIEGTNEVPENAEVVDRVEIVED